MLRCIHGECELKQALMCCGTLFLTYMAEHETCEPPRSLKSDEVSNQNAAKWGGCPWVQSGREQCCWLFWDNTVQHLNIMHEPECWVEVSPEVTLHESERLIHFCCAGSLFEGLYYKMCFANGYVFRGFTIWVLSVIILYAWVLCIRATKLQRHRVLTYKLLGFDLTGTPGNSHSVTSIFLPLLPPKLQQLLHVVFVINYLFHA